MKTEKINSIKHDLSLFYDKEWNTDADPMDSFLIICKKHGYIGFDSFLEKKQILLNSSEKDISLFISKEICRQKQIPIIRVKLKDSIDIKHLYPENVFESVIKSFIF